MNFQPLIDNLPMILAALGLLLWAAARFVDSRAKSDPKIDKWDEWAPKLKWASAMYSEAIDWLCRAGVLNVKGEEKLKLLNALVKEFEAAIETGNYKEAINAVMGYWIAAKNKVAANPPTAQELTADTPAQE